MLIGDAAHANPPSMMGEGGCMAVEDAWVLAEVLRARPGHVRRSAETATRLGTRAESHGDSRIFPSPGRPQRSVARARRPDDAPPLRTAQGGAVSVSIKREG